MEDALDEAWEKGTNIAEKANIAAKERAVDMNTEKVEFETSDPEEFEKVLKRQNALTPEEFEDYIDEKNAMEKQDFASAAAAINEATSRSREVSIRSVFSINVHSLLKPICLVVS